MTHLQRPRRRRILGLALTSALLSSGALAVQEGPELLEGVRTTLQEYVATQRLISQEKRDWALGKDVVESQIELVQQQLETLRTQIAEARSKITDADLEREKLIAERDRLEASSSSIQTALGGLETRTRGLVERLPEPLRDRIAVLSQRLPEDPQASEMSVTERFPNIVGILNEVNKFDRDVSTTSEVRQLADGRRAEVATLYVGLGQAYYVGAQDDIAGIGSAGPQGWVWTSSEDAAPAIRQLIGIKNDGQPAAFVRVPTRVE